MLKGNIKDHSGKTVWAEYKDGFEVEIRYLPRGALNRILEDSKKKTWDPAAAIFLEKRDDGRFYQLVAERILVNWRGLKPEVLKKLVDMESYPETEVPFSVEDAAELLEKAYELDLWVQRIATNLEYYEATRRAAEEKNS